MKVAANHTSFWRHMWMVFNVGIRLPGPPSFFDCNPAQASCLNFALLKISGAFGADGIMLGTETPLSWSVSIARETRTWSSSLSRSVLYLLLNRSDRGLIFVLC
jgi:hypothetical protein